MRGQTRVFDALCPGRSSRVLRNAATERPIFLRDFHQVDYHVLRPFPLVGTYTENLACKTDGSDARVSRITITPRDIDSVFGLCTILSKKREGATFVVHVECKGPGGSQMLSDVNLTPREDKTIDFSDQDQTYKAVLYRCPD